MLTVNTNKRTQTAYIKSLVETGVKCGGGATRGQAERRCEVREERGRLRGGTPAAGAGCSLCGSGGPLALEFI